MDLEFANPRHEKLVNDPDALSKKYDGKGQHVSDEILGTINVLHAAEALSDVPRSYSPHPLQGNYKGFFAVDVTKTHRVIFKPNDGDNFQIDNFKSIKRVVIVEIYKDYH